MKYKNILISLGLGAALLGGCGGNGDSGDTIVGKWHKGCYQPDDNLDDNEYRIEDFQFKADKTMTLEVKRYHDDASCTNLATPQEFEGQYNIGEATEGDDGKVAYELDLDNSNYTEDEQWADYRMYRFIDNDHLLISEHSTSHNGSDRDLRADHFHAPGFERQ